jgi:esterase/lipase superfamily enzyme
MNRLMRPEAKTNKLAGKNLLRWDALVALCISMIALSGCAGNQQYRIDLMPAPDVYDEEQINPLADNSLLENSPYEGILYVTDRTPAGQGDKEEFYLNERGAVVRAGVATIDVEGVDMTWEEARAISLAKTRTTKYPLKVDEVDEFGVLRGILPYGFLSDPADYEGEPAADQKFIEMINGKLAASSSKDIYIYVHGYKVVFENPILVASELWHFLGYDGVFIAYSWPSTPKRIAYFKDIETSRLTARNLRMLLKFLAQRTDAERIHLVGYSAGTRVIISAIQQLAFEYTSSTKEEVQAKLRIANVSLVGSDYDRTRFGGAMADGFLKVPAVTTIYTSGHDSALGLSRWIFDEQRLGELANAAISSQTIRDFLTDTDDIYIVDVTDAEGSERGNGHAYFRDSPWASSDLLMTLMYNLSPRERGLVRPDGELAWSFPPDYISRLRQAIFKADPALGDAIQEQGSTSTDIP